LPRNSHPDVSDQQKRPRPNLSLQLKIQLTIETNWSINSATFATDLQTLAIPIGAQLYNRPYLKAKHIKAVRIITKATIAKAIKPIPR